MPAIIGLRITPEAGVMDVADQPDPLNTAFEISADVSEQWHVHMRQVFSYAWPTPDGELMIFGCVADECGPVNPYGWHVAESFGVLGREFHGDVYVLRLATDDDQGPDSSHFTGGMFTAMDDSTRAGIRSQVAREAGAVNRERVGAPVGD